MDEIPFGYCHCGCGKKTNIAAQNRNDLGWVKGEPVRYLRGHKRGEGSPNWKSGTIRRPKRYVLILMPDHPRADGGGYVPEHVLVCEKALGKHLPPESQPHHWNGKKDDNQPQNLVLCQDYAYHQLLHQRQRAYAACGHASWRKCWICKQYVDPENLSMVVKKDRKGSIMHRVCYNAYKAKQKREKKKEKQHE